jgi:hypothetical protein
MDMSALGFATASRGSPKSVAAGKPAFTAVWSLHALKFLLGAVFFSFIQRPHALVLIKYVFRRGRRQKGRRYASARHMLFQVPEVRLRTHRSLRRVGYLIGAAQGPRYLVTPACLMLLATVTLRAEKGSECIRSASQGGDSTGSAQCSALPPDASASIATGFVALAWAGWECRPSLRRDARVQQIVSRGRFNLQQGSQNAE